MRSTDRLASLRGVRDELAALRAREAALVEARNLLVVALDEERDDEGERVTGVGVIADAAGIEREQVRRIRAGYTSGRHATRIRRLAERVGAHAA